MGEGHIISKPRMSLQEMRCVMRAFDAGLSIAHCSYIWDRNWRTIKNVKAYMEAFYADDAGAQQPVAELSGSKQPD